MSDILITPNGIRNLKAVDNIKIPFVRNFNDHVYHLYVIKCDYRDKLAYYVKLHGVQTVINHLVSIPFLFAFKLMNHLPQDCPNVFSNQSEILLLTIYHEMPVDHLEKVISLIYGFEL